MCPIEWPGRPDRNHAPHHLLVPGVRHHPVGERVEDLAVVLEQPLHPAGRRPLALSVVHPEAPLVRRHADLGARERRAAVKCHEATHVIAVEVGDDHDVDVVGADPDRREVAHEEAGGRAGLLGGVRTAARVDEHRLARRSDHRRVERSVAMTFGDAVSTVGRLHLVNRALRTNPSGTGAVRSPSGTTMTSISPTA